MKQQVIGMPGGRDSNGAANGKGQSLRGSGGISQNSRVPGPDSKESGNIGFF